MGFMILTTDSRIRVDARVADYSRFDLHTRTIYTCTLRNIESRVSHARPANPDTLDTPSWRTQSRRRISLNNARHWPSSTWRESFSWRQVCTDHEATRVNDPVSRTTRISLTDCVRIRTRIADIESSSRLRSSVALVLLQICNIYLSPIFFMKIRLLPYF